MINNDWAGVSATLGDQVKAMLDNSGLVRGECPSPPQNISLHASIDLPALPPLLAGLGIVDVMFLLLSFVR